MTDESHLSAHIGSRISKLRKEHKLSLEELSKKSGVDLESLKRIESNQHLPAIGDLIQVANALNTSIGTFFQTRLPDQRVEYVKASNRWNVPNQESLSVPLHYKYQALSYQLTDKLMAPFFVEIPPGKEEAPVSSHKGEEFLFLISGSLLLNIDGEDYTLEKGDSIYFDSRLKHSLKAIGSETAQLIAVIADAEPKKRDDVMGRAFRKN